MKKISYVMPVYNSQSTVARAIASILNQEIPPHELIVIDDGSDDNTPRILDFYKDKIKLITNNERKGAAYCRNLGNRTASGSIIAVCDADFYYKSRSKAIDQFFTEYKDKDVFYSALHIRHSKDYLYDYIMDAYEWDFKSKCPISHPTVAYRRKVLEKVQYKELTKESDLFEFFLLDAHKAGFKFGGCQNPLMLKIEGSRKRDKKESTKVKKELYGKYGIKV